MPDARQRVPRPLISEMKKSTIWILTVLIAITFLGLLYMQIMYMDSMIKMREDQFTEGVKHSLFGVVNQLEMDEAQSFIEDEVEDVEASSIYSQYREGIPHMGGIKYSITTMSGMEADLTIKGNYDQMSRFQSDPTILFNSFSTAVNNRKQMVDRVFLNLVNQALDKPIEQRADSTTLRQVLDTHLSNNGLELPAEFAVIDHNGLIRYSTGGFVNKAGNADDNDSFVMTLFPNDPVREKYYLKVYFPTKTYYIQKSIKFMIPSFAFTFVLLVIFLFTIILAFRQKKLNEMKNDFINNMTHEFKTPISTISLASQMLNDPSVRKSPDMLRHISSVINDETKRLRFQVEKVLQMSMFDKHKATLRIQEVDANIAISNIINTFKLKVEKYGGRLTANLDAQDAMVNVDEMHFTNVIFNLLDNAVKYRRDDTPLNLTVTTVDIPGDRLEITVADNGIGIRKENLKRIFEKFYRVPTGNRQDVQGFGLGLAYVHKMVDMMGGTIKAESDTRTGSKFIIILPLIKN